MPNYLHSFRAGEETRINTRRLLPIIGLATVVAYVVSCYAILTLTYDKGGSSLNSYTYASIPRWVGWISSLVQYGSGRENMAAFGMTLGAGLTLFLLVMRHSFIWWPLHPIGFILGGSTPLYHLWSCCVHWLDYQTQHPKFWRSGNVSKMAVLFPGVDMRGISNGRFLDGS